MIDEHMIDGHINKVSIIAEVYVVVILVLY